MHRAWDSLRSYKSVAVLEVPAGKFCVVALLGEALGVVKPGGGAGGGGGLERTFTFRGSRQRDWITRKGQAAAMSDVHESRTSRPKCVYGAVVPIVTLWIF